MVKKNYYISVHEIIGQNNIESLMAYHKRHQETGGFLRAVLEGDLYRACIVADIHNQGKIFDIVRYIINTLPGECYGSKERVNIWLKNK